MKTKIILLFLTALMFGAHAQKASKAEKIRPEWCHEIPGRTNEFRVSEKIYPSGKYLARIGKGPSKDEAKKSALQNLVTYLKAETSVTTRADSLLSDEDGVYSKKRVVRETTEISSAMDFHSLEYAPNLWFNPADKSWYACVMIDRQREWDFFKMELKKQKTSFDSFYDRGEDETDLLTKIAYYRRASATGGKILEILDTMVFLLPETDEAYPALSKKILGIDGKIAELSQKCSFSLKVENDIGKGNGNFRAKISEIFSNAGCRIASSGEKAFYTIRVEVLPNIESDDDPECPVYTASPVIELKVTNGERTLLSYSAIGGKCGPTFTKDKIISAMTGILSLKLEEELPDEIGKKLLGK